jgi:hypothetical protein
MKRVPITPQAVEKGFLQDHMNFLPRSVVGPIMGQGVEKLLECRI